MAKDMRSLAVSAQEKNTKSLAGQERPLDLNSLMMRSVPQFEKALLGSGENAQRFARICLSVVKGNEKLCEIAYSNPLSIVAACMDIAALGLDPSIPNETYIVPYGNEAKQQTGYKGLIKLARRAAIERGNPLAMLMHGEIYERDFYERELGFETRLTHRPPPFGQPRGALLGFYALYAGVKGDRGFVEMTKEEVLEHQKRFCKGLKNPKSPFYDGQNFSAYGLKTVMRRLILRNMDMSNKLASAILSDEDDEKTDTYGAAVIAPQDTTTPEIEAPSTPSVLDMLPSIDDLPEGVAKTSLS